MIQKQKVKTERISLHLPTDTVESLKLLAAKNHTDMSKEIRRFIDKGLAVKSYEDNIDQSVDKPKILFLRRSRRIFRFSADMRVGKTHYKRKTAE